MGLRILSLIKIKLFFMLLCSQTFLVPNMISDRSVRRWHFLVNRSCVGGCGKKLEVVGKIFGWVQMSKRYCAQKCHENHPHPRTFCSLLWFLLFTWRSNHLLPFLKDIRSDRVQLKKMKLQIRYSEWFSWWYFLLTWNKVVLRQSLGLRA